MSIESQLIARIQKAMPEVKAIYLFGSQATGTARPDSDYDVAVLAPESLEGNKAFFKLQLDLASLTDNGVNVVDLRMLPVVLQFEVLCARKRLFCADRSYCVLFEADIISDYQRFAQERQIIIDTFFKKRADAARQQISR